MQENQITDVVDMTNSAAQTSDQEDSDSKAILEGLPKETRLFTPIFTTPNSLREHKQSKQSTQSPVMPGIVYPFQLERYQFPCDLASYLFWQSYKAASTTLDCQAVGVNCGQDLLSLVSAPKAADFIANLIAPDSDLSQQKSASDSSDDEGAKSGELNATVISVQQLC